MQKANSLTAFIQEVKPTLSKRQQAVLSEIEKNPGQCAKTYAYEMKVPVNSISGRFGELESKGKIEETGTIYINGRPNALWRVKVVKPVLTPEQQLKQQLKLF